MVSPTKILTATLLLKMIQKTRSCLVLYPIDEIIWLEEHEEKSQETQPDTQTTQLNTKNWANTETHRNDSLIV